MRSAKVVHGLDGFDGAEDAAALEVHVFHLHVQRAQLGLGSHHDLVAAQGQHGRGALGVIDDVEPDLLGPCAEDACELVRGVRVAAGAV